jgi:hypothetical protein
MEFRANGDSFSGMTKNVSREGISTTSAAFDAKPEL